MNHARTIKTHTMLLEGTPESVFPLLCPIREYAWIEPWRCTLIYSESGYAEQDCVFQTDFPQAESLPDDGPDAQARGRVSRGGGAGPGGRPITP